MTDIADRIVALVNRFEQIQRTEMRGLPILNPRLVVEVVGNECLDDHAVCVLITPWFMNVVLLPGADDWAGLDQGASCEIVLPRQALDFNVCHDDRLGTFLTAVLFRTVSDFPDRETARYVALEVLQELLSAATAQARDASATESKVISRRSLLTGLGAD